MSFLGTLFGGSNPNQAAQTPNLQSPINGGYAGALPAQTQNQLIAQQGLTRDLAQAGGIANQSDVYNQQQALAQQLSQMAQGQGPNPALAQLANTTGQNVSQQAALMAGQRGAGANAGLLARQAAEQGGQIQQNAAGQAAALRAQQQLGAIGALQQQQGMLGNLATTQVGQQVQSQQAQTGATLAQQQAILGQLNAQNQAQLGSAGISSQNANASAQRGAGLLGGILSGAATVGAAALAEGGEMPNMQQGGPEVALKENYKGKSKIGSILMAKGGKVHNMKAGGHVPGKPVVGGAKDSYANDKVNAILSPGEIVIPRSVTQSANPVEGAAKFVAAIKSKKGKK